MSEELSKIKRLYNESMISAYALGCSQKFRAGKFTRVGSDFIAEIETDMENFIRKIRGMEPESSMVHPPAFGDSDSTAPAFTTGAFAEKIGAEIDRYMARLIQNKVQRQPSVGVTLRATR